MLFPDRDTIPARPPDEAWRLPESVAVPSNLATATFGVG